MAQIPRRISHARRISAVSDDRAFNYKLDFAKTNFRVKPELYRVGRGEQGVLLVEPYKGEILPFWKFRTPKDARKSSAKILSLFETYKRKKDFVGMDMARKFLQMGFTRSRRYANHKSGTKYDADFNILVRSIDEEKAESAAIFFKVWKSVEGDVMYADWKLQWKLALG